MDTDLIPIPSLRPDGRLERLHYGGGNNKQKMDNWMGDIDAYKKATGNSPYKGPQNYQKFTAFVNSGGADGKSGPSATKAKPAATVGNAAAVSADRPPPATSAATATAAPKKKRTLLSGQQSLSCSRRCQKHERAASLSLGTRLNEG